MKLAFEKYASIHYANSDSFLSFEFREPGGGLLNGFIPIRVQIEDQLERDIQAYDQFTWGLRTVIEAELVAEWR